MQNRVFFPQAALDLWLSDGIVELQGTELTITSEARSYRLVEGARFVSEVTGTPDPHELVGRVKAKTFLEEKGAELMEDSAILGDNAYQIVPGFIGAPVGTFEEFLASAEHQVRAARTPEGSPSSEEELLGRLLAKTAGSGHVNLFVEGALFLVTALAYLAACGLFLAYLASERFAWAGKVAPRFVAAGAALHAAHIVVASLVWHVCPVAGVHFAMSVVSMFACVVYLVMRRRYRIDVVGAFVAPLALTFLLASRFVGGQVAMGEPSAGLKTAILPIHVIVNLLGDALFTLAFAAAVAYLLQERLLKEKRVDGLFRRLPALDALDRAEHRFLLAGFPLLTIGILTGTFWARHVEAGTAADVARAAFGYATWVLFAGVLLLRAGAGWRGRRAAYGTIAGFGFAVVVLVLYLVRSSVPAATADAGMNAGGPAFMPGFEGETT